MAVMLFESLMDDITSRRTVTSCSPYKLVYGHEVVLLFENTGVGARVKYQDIPQKTWVMWCDGVKLNWCRK